MEAGITWLDDQDRDTYLFEMPFPKGLKWKATFTGMEEMPAYEFDMTISELSERPAEPYAGTLAEALRTMARAAAAMIRDFTLRSRAGDVAITCVFDETYAQLFGQFICPLNRFLGREFQVFAIRCSRQFRVGVAPSFQEPVRRLFIIRRKYTGNGKAAPQQVAHPIIFFEEDEKTFFNEKEGQGKNPASEEAWDGETARETL